MGTRSRSAVWTAVSVSAALAAAARTGWQYAASQTRLITAGGSITNGRASSNGSTSAALSRPPTPESVVQRTIFVRVRPAPASLSERRAVLRALERHGKTDMFKRLADSASFIAIASTSSMATTLIQSSPMQYEFLAERTLETAHPWGRPRAAADVQPIETRMVAAENADAEAAAESAPHPSASSSSPGHVLHKSFVLSVFPSPDYFHQRAIRSSPLHASWPRSDGDDDDAGFGDSRPNDRGADSHPNSIRRSLGTGTKTRPAALLATGRPTYKQTFVYHALRAVVPEGPAKEALCDWRQDLVPAGADAPSHGTAASASATATASFSAASQATTEGRLTPSRETQLAHVQQRKARRELASRSAVAQVVAASTAAAEARTQSSAPPPAE